ncbi:MAG: hypothetical protein ACOWWR_16965 [Eubacteriales bacterium]
MHIRKSIVSTVLSLALFMPSVAFASSIDIMYGGKDLAMAQTTSVNETLSEENSKPELTPEVKTKIQELKTKLNNGEITKEQFHQEMKKIMPEGFEFKHRRKDAHEKIKLTDEAKEKLEDLKTKFKNGEITKEKFKEEMEKILPKKN